MAVKFGRAKHNSKLTLDDFMRNPIWVSAHDERHDEEWFKPIMKPTQVTAEILRVNHPILTVRVEGTTIYGTASYSHEDNWLYGFGFWLRNKSVPLTSRTPPKKLAPLEFPLTLVPLASILGAQGLRFLLKKPTDHAAKRRA